jgi:anti-anti-sigma factor
MRHDELKIWTDNWDGNPVVGAEGEVDLSSVDQLRTAASLAVREKPTTLIFDFRKVTFIDSSGLGILVATRKQLQNNPDAVVVVTNQPAVLQSLQLTGLDRVVRVINEPAAVTT